MKKSTFAGHLLLPLFFLLTTSIKAQVIISQYYEGTGTNKWIELTNLGNSAVNTASPQLQLGLWAVSGSTGNISFAGAATNTVNLTVTIPAKGSVLIGNTGNGTEISYLTAGSAAQTANSVINFNGNDGIALLNAGGTIIDRFGDGINATDISYVRNVSVTGQSAAYVPSQWTSAVIAAVQSAAANSPTRLGYHLAPLCATPASQPTALVFGTITSSSIAASFTSTINADEYLVVQSTSSSLSSNPADGTTYSAGNALGGGTVVSRAATTSFTASGLSSNTTYYFFIFSIKSAACSGGPAYRTTGPLTGNRTTSSGTLNFYYGNLHAHSSYSDGNSDDDTKIPSDDYAFAKTALCMDFLGISEHNHVEAGMHLSNWPLGRSQATTATAANFVAMYGMEWGVISGGGHVVVYGMDSLVGWDPGEYQIYVAKNVYTGTGGLFDIINRHGNNALAYLAHPNNSDYNNLYGGSYDVTADNAVVGSAVESGPANSTNTTYTNPAASMGHLSYYRNLLSKGYHIGPTMDHDNHKMTFGHTAKSRLVILASSLTEASLLSAMRQMHFYASEDCGARISYTVNTQPMGSILHQAGAPVFSIGSVTTASVTSLKIMYGVPGSGSNATQLTSTASGSLSYTDNALANLSTRYYYLDITESDGTRIITAPVWYTRDDAARMPSSLTSFYTVNEKDKVILKWTTENEQKDQLFEIERSVDGGKTFTRIGSRPGGGGRITPNYAIEDINPTDGLAWYRLLQRNSDGSTSFSDIKVVNRSKSSISFFTVYPNPVHDVLNIKLTAALSGYSTIEVFDLAGRKQVAQAITVYAGEQGHSVDMSKLQKGTYLVKIKMGDKTLSQLVNKF